MTSADRLWGIEDVSDCLGIPVQTLYQWRTKGYGPTGCRMGKYVRFEPDEVRAWVKSLMSDAA